MTKITCDKCGKEIVINPFMNVSAKDPHIIIKKKGSIWNDESIDLCSDCQKAFLKWLNEEALPQEQKVGHWIPSKDYECRPVWECSLCRSKWDNNPNFCPECGAKMIGVTNQGTWNECIACCSNLIQQKINALKAEQEE